MAKFNSEDQKNLEQLLEEGWMDRLKTRGAEALGNIKGVGQRAMGGVQHAVGSVLKDDELAQRGSQNLRSGSASGQNSKIEYLKKNIDQRIQKFVDDINNDIQKLGLNVGKIEFVSAINDALDQLKQSVDAPTPPPLPSRATPPPLPQDTEKEESEKPEYSYPPKRTQKSIPVKKADKFFQKKRPQKQNLTTNPKKGKVNPNALRDRLSRPEEEEDSF